MENYMNVLLLDLKAQYRAIKPEIMAAIEAVCDEQGFILGPRVVELEQALAKYVGAIRAIGCASGTDALVLQSVSRPRVQLSISTMPCQGGILFASSRH